MLKQKTTKQKWLEKGYEHFALYGPEISVNKISKEIGSPRASFYHHFGDVDIFIEELLDMHWKAGQQFSSVGAERCKKLFPDLYELVAEYPIPLLFARQLFLNRHVPEFNFMFIKMYKTHANEFILDLFAEQLGLHQTKENLFNLWLSLGESWYSRLDPDDLSAKIMQSLAEEIIDSLIKFISTDLYSRIHK